MQHYPLKPHERIIVALDFPTLDDAVGVCESLKGKAAFYKVGLQLFLKHGPEAVRRITNYGSVFLDLKLNDIPNTMKGGVKSAACLGVRMLTVHCSSGKKALEAAVKEANGDVLIIGVTVLTSMLAEEIEQIGVMSDLNRVVVQRAVVAKDSGCHGVICSAKENQEIRRACGKEFLIINPGIRPPWYEHGGDDQRRICSPSEAISLGADMIVVGRPITSSSSPPRAFDKILSEIEKVSP